MIPELDKGKESTASLENDSTARLGKCFHSQIGLIHFHSQVREMLPQPGKENQVKILSTTNNPKIKVTYRCVLLLSDSKIKLTICM